MPLVGHVRLKRLLVAGLLAATLAACGRPEPLQTVGVANVPPPGPPAPTTSFQGAVASVDIEAGAVVVAVQIVWTPVLKAHRHDRRVVVDAGTTWDPGSLGLAGLQVGEEVQVEALDEVDGSWPALRVRRFDVD